MSIAGERDRRFGQWPASAQGDELMATARRSRPEPWTSPVSPVRLLREIDQAVLVADPQGTIVFWNAAAERLYGWTGAEAVGRDASEFLAAGHAAAGASTIMKRLLAGESWSGELSLRRRDGSSFAALVTDTPVFADDGSLAAIIGVSRDVSNIHAVEQSLAATEGRFRALVE